MQGSALTGLHPACENCAWCNPSRQECAITRQASQSWHRIVDQHPAGRERQLWNVCEVVADTEDVRLWGETGVTSDRENDAFDRAPRGREPSVREGLTRINVDWSGSWQAARPGNWLGRSPATRRPWAAE